MRAAPAVSLCLGLCACAAPIDLPDTCDAALQRVSPGERGPTLARQGDVAAGESLPVFRYRSDRSLAMTYGRSVALACIVLDAEPQPNERLRRAIDDALDGQLADEAAFDASGDARVSLEGADPLLRIQVSDPSRATEIDFDTLEPGVEDAGIGDQQAEVRAREVLDEIVETGLINDTQLELVASSRTVGTTSEASFVTRFEFVFGYVPGGIRAFGPECAITIDREGLVLAISLAEADLSIASEARVEIDGAEAEALLEAYQPQVETFFDPVGPAWFPPSEATGDQAVQELRYYGEVSRGIRWISMMNPDDGVGQTP